MRTYKEQDKILYCYKAEETEDGLIIRRHSISRYNLEYHGTRLHAIYFEGKANGISSFIHDNIHANKLEKVLYLKCFTFSDDFDEVISRFEKSAEQTLQKARKKYEAAQVAYEKSLHCIGEEYNPYGA